MASRIADLQKICRFCLSHQGLTTLQKATSTAFTLDDVVLYAGLQISEDEKLIVAICSECCRTINNAITFRRICLKNDGIFKTIVSALNVSLTGYAPNSETRNHIQHTDFSKTCKSDDQIIILGDTDSDDSMSCFNWTVESEVAKEIKSVESSGPTCASKNTGERQSSTEHSANINLISPDGSESDNSLASLYGEAMAEHMAQQPSNVSELQEANNSKGKELCPHCGIMVHYIHSHIKRRHYKEAKYACPYCPVKKTQSYDLNEHINTWHEKRITRTCEHCGKSYYNYKSYSYHMVNSHGKSDIYECKICHRKLKSYDGYKKHKKEHSGTSVPCNDCGRLYANNTTFQSHILRYHQNGASE